MSSCCATARPGRSPSISQSIRCTIPSGLCSEPGPLSRASRAGGSRMPPAVVWDALSRDRLAVVAQHAIDTPAFRADAKDVTKTEATIEADAALAAKLQPFGPLDHEE